MIWNVWAPVVAGLGLSLLTLAGALGLDRHRARGRAKSATHSQLEAAYTGLYTESLGDVIFAGGMRQTALIRSGIAEVTSANEQCLLSAR